MSKYFIADLLQFTSNYENSMADPQNTNCIRVPR